MAAEAVGGVKQQSVMAAAAAVGEVKQQSVMAAAAVEEVEQQSVITDGNKIWFSLDGTISLPQLVSTVT